MFVYCDPQSFVSHGTLLANGDLAEALALVMITVVVLSGVEYLENSIRRLRSGVHARQHPSEETGQEKKKKN